MTLRPVVIVVAAAILLGLALPRALAAMARGPVPAPDCFFDRATAGGGALVCPNGGILNVVDIQGGSDVPGRPGMLNLNIGAGNSAKRGNVVINPDVGNCLIVKDGRRHTIASMCPQRAGGARFHRGLTVCDRRGCVDVLKQLREGKRHAR